MKNNFKKMAIVFSCAAFLLITAGISVAFFQYMKVGSSANTITTGSIVFHYQELDGKGHGISITNALPVDKNYKAKTMDEAFDFDITSKTVEKVVVPYTVTARLDKNADLVMGDIVDVYLTEVNGTTEAPTDLFNGVVPKYNELEQYDGVEGYTEKVIYEGQVPANKANYKKNFRLRIWIDEKANFGKQCSINPSVNDTQEKCSTAQGTWDYRYNDKTFSITVNVYASGRDTGNERGLAALIRTAIEGGVNPTGGVDPETGEPTEELIPPIPDPNDDDNKDDNDCDPSIDSTCRECDPSTDPKCGDDHVKRDQCTDYTNGICKTEDDDDNGDGEDDDIYYYRGREVNNYLKLGDDDTLWKIVRINGDGTIKIVRTAAISTSIAFNTYANSSNYMKYTNSSLKKQLDAWYMDNIVKNDLDLYVASGNHFCQDAKPTLDNPTFDCTTSGLINADIGLVSASEALKITGSFYVPDMLSMNWTTTPKEYNSNARLAFAWFATPSGPANMPVTGTAAAYPVINLKADVKVTGTGTKIDPYVVVLNKKILEKPLNQYVLDDNPTRLTNPTLTHTSKSVNENGFYQKTVTDGFGGGDGTTYYFRGDVTNNVVYFAGLPWRIMRINEDGTVRLILDITTIDWSINGGGFPFNNSATQYEDMYYSNTGETGAKKHVEDWYAEHITGSDDAKVAEGNYFCEAWKVTPWSSSTTPRVDTDHDEDYNYFTTGYQPDFKCQDDFNGHGLVSGKVGLPTYDEMVFSGSIFGISNYDTYLIKGTTGEMKAYWWTMTPAQTNYANWDIKEYLGTGTVTSDRHYRPVINLKATTTARKLDNGYYLVK